MNTDEPARQPIDFAAGLPIFDRNGVQIGVVSPAGVQEQYLMMTEGRLFHHDVGVPVSAIERSDGTGIYLNRTEQEIHDLTLGGWSSLGNVDLDSGTPASGSASATDSAPPNGEDVRKGDS